MGFKHTGGGHGGLTTVSAFHQRTDNNNMIVLQELFERVAIYAQTEEFENIFFSWPGNKIVIQNENWTNDNNYKEVTG